MTRDAAPMVGEWYRRLDRPQAFQVVAFDAPEGTVDIEYFDGTIDEWPISHWYELPIEPCDAPQDSSGPFDAIDGDGYEEGGIEDHSHEAIDQGPIETPDDVTVPPHARVFDAKLQPAGGRSRSRTAGKRRR
jgi:hypothetical protein